MFNSISRLRCKNIVPIATAAAFLVSFCCRILFWSLPTLVDLLIILLYPPPWIPLRGKLFGLLLLSFKANISSRKCWVVMDTIIDYRLSKSITHFSSRSMDPSHCKACPAFLPLARLRQSGSSPSTTAQSNTKQASGSGESAEGRGTVIIIPYLVWDGQGWY